MKKTIIFAIAALIIFSGCESIGTAQAVDGTPSVSLTTMPLLTEQTEPEEFFPETGYAPPEIPETEYTAAGITETGYNSTEMGETETSFAGNSTEISSEKPEMMPVGGEAEEIPEAAEVLPESISLSLYSVSLQIGESKMPIVTMLPENTSDKSEIWTSSDSGIASVNELGNITGISEGSCTVRVTAAKNPDVYAEVEVTVTANPEITYIDGILVVNKTYALPADYNPGVDPTAQSAFDKMQADAAELGLNIYISSGFRSYDYQAGLYQRYVNRSGQAEADRYSARPGHSEHQTGLAFDLNSITDEFKDTAEGKWVTENCQNYGFIIRYPEGKEDITGYIYEPWHIRYLGIETAQAVYESGLTLEEYLGITSKYSE